MTFSTYVADKASSNTVLRLRNSSSIILRKGDEIDFGLIQKDVQEVILC